MLPQKLRFSPELTVTVNSGKPPSIGNFNITKGYKIEPILWNLTLPSSVAFDDAGNMYVAEAGYAYGELETTPQILKIDVNGTISSFVDRHLYGPITDLVYHQGKLYVSNRGKISTVDIQNRHVQDIIMALPSLGDHPVDQIAFGPDGRMYFGIGTATNSGVVGEDNYEWLKLLPTFHDIPAKQIKLAGQNFNSRNLLAPVTNGKNVTGAFSPFGNSTRRDELLKGDVKCSGCIISSKADGTDLKLVAWGIRNPYGLTFEKGNGLHLIVTDSGAEERGSRPIANDSDKVYSIDVSNPSNLGKFYGWPDFYGNAEPVTEPKFQSASNKQQLLEFLMQEHPTVEKPLSLLGGVNGIAQIAFSNNSDFGFKGMGFIAQLGKILPATTTSIDTAKQNGKIIGQKIVILDTGKKGNFRNFVSLKKADPNFRPVSVKFNRDNTALYIVSIGKEEIRKTLPNGYPLPRPTPWFYQHSGVVWKVTNASSVVGLAASQPPKKLHLSPELTVTINSGKSPSTDAFNLPSQYKMEPVLWNLDLPGSFAFDNRGNMYVASVGITYGRVTTNPNIIKIDHNGTVSTFVDRFLHGTLSDIEFDKNNGLLYVSHRALISTVNLTSGVVKDLVTALPMTDYGTHPMGQLSIGPDGRIYFGVGSVSNTAVPDVSDYGIGWIRDMPQLHEIKLIGGNIMLAAD